MKRKILSLFGRGDGDVPQFPSIYEHIREHIPETGPGLKPGGEKLPDDEHLRDETGLGWAPGALDGVSARHVGVDPSKVARRVAKLHAALVRLADKPSAATRYEVERLFLEEFPRPVLDSLLAQLGQYPPRDQARLYQELRAMLLHTGHSGIVKSCLPLVGVFADPADAELFRVFGRHEEFTLYAAVALAKVTGDPIPEWLHLAKHVTGWGRIELVELLLDKHPPAEVCGFLLRDGASNSIMDEYTAVPISRTCRLHEALEEGLTDDALLRGAAVLLEAMCNLEGPGENMLDYPEAGRAAEKFLQILGPRSSSLDDYMTVDAIGHFAEGEHGEQELQGCDWSPERSKRIHALVSRILDQDAWVERARAALRSPDEAEQWKGRQVARRLGVPLRAVLAESLDQTPLNDGLWYELAHSNEESEMDDTLELAKRLLDIDAIATGPDVALGLGPEYRLHRCVDYLIQELERFPGKGWDFIRPALGSPVVRNRHMALRALEAWPPMFITSEIKKHLEAGIDDPDENVGAKCREILDTIARG